MCRLQGQPGPIKAAMEIYEKLVPAAVIVIALGAVRMKVETFHQDQLIDDTLFPFFDISPTLKNGR